MIFVMSASHSVFVVERAEMLSALSSWTAPAAEGTLALQDGSTGHPSAGRVPLGSWHDAFQATHSLIPVH